MTLKVLCARSMTTAVNALAAKFTRASGQELDITFATVGALQARVAGGERADILILGAPACEDGAGGRDRTGEPQGHRAHLDRRCRAQRRTGASISTAEAFKQTLGAARVIAFSDAWVGGSAGVHLAQLWGRMGMADEIKRKAMPQKSGGEVATRVAEGQADIGLTLIAEIVPIPGVRVVGKIPAPLGNDTTYAAGISADCAVQAAAAAFITALAAPAERDTWTAAGFEWPG
jgi:molybdate transport system substrate-binding protein